jgi:metal-responsive CopG/Arc/MetJ family transcriptional regulator
MAMRKTAVTIPEELLAEVDAAAEARGESRSRYITRLLRLTVQARRDAEVTRRLNELFAREDNREELRRSARGLDRVGTDWKERGW